MPPRRSKHAEQRAKQGRRVSDAARDVQQARKVDVFVDDMGNVYVVRGDKQREHVINHDGVIVTTINSRSQSAHRERLRKGIIRPSTDDEFNQLKALFK